MTRLIVAFITACLHLVPAHAQVNTCPALPQQVVVYFGNGINTDQESARRSRDLLRDNLGTTHNNKTLRYDTAYNATDGMALDLVQAARQAGVQWDSELVSWLDRLNLAPGWFVGWYQQQIEQRSLTYAPELDQHVDSYRNAISLGQRVLVVSHSQGNFYANEAKRFLRQRLTTEQMARFAIYGVAVPTNNIDGSSGPYLTNHRDFISLIPDALPANFTLRRGEGGLPADDVGRIQAHLFNDTYLSDDFNIRPALVLGLQTALDGFSSLPPAQCVDNLRAYVLAQFSGEYTCYDSNDGEEAVVGSTTVGRDGRFAIQSRTSGAFDVTDPNVDMGFSWHPGLEKMQAINVLKYLHTAGSAEQVESSGTLTFKEAGHFEHIGTAIPASAGGGSCDTALRRSHDQSSTHPQKPIGELLSGAIEVLAGPRRLRFEAGECAYAVYPPVPHPGAIEVEFTPAGFRMNDRTVPWREIFPREPLFHVFQRDLTNEGVPRANDFLTRLVHVGNNGLLSFQADPVWGLRHFTFFDNGMTLTCGNKRL